MQRKKAFKASMYKRTSSLNRKAPWVLKVFNYVGDELI